MVRTVEVGSLNLPSEVMKIKKMSLGNMHLQIWLQAIISLIARSQTNRLRRMPTYIIYQERNRQYPCRSNLLQRGYPENSNLVILYSVIAPDYQKQGETVIPPELKYVEVIAVTAGSGYDANTGEEDPEEKELPSTVTLLATPEQSRILAMMEKDGNLHISLVYRGTKENAAKFITEQEHALQELYPPETEAAEAETGQPEEQIEGSAE